MDPRLREAIKALQVEGPFLRMVRTATSFEHAQKLLEEFRAAAKDNYRRLAMEAHPDRGGSDEAMQELNKAKDLVARIDVRPPVRRPVTMVRIYSTGMGNDIWTSSSSSTTTTGTGYGW